MNRPHLKLHPRQPIQDDDELSRFGALTPLIVLALPFWLGVALGWVAHAWIGG